MTQLRPIWEWLRNIGVTSSASTNRARHMAQINQLAQLYGLKIVEQDPKGNARPWRHDEIAIIEETMAHLGPAFRAALVNNPIHVWIDRNPGGGSFGNKWLRIGEPGSDTSILYRIFLHESTHAVNEYLGWPYEQTYCMLPGLDWRKEREVWRHPRQQGYEPEPGNWETLPVDSRDVSTAPGEDLAETVRYFVHSVKGERQWLWPVDQSQPGVFLWDTSPTRFIYVRDHLLKLPEQHPWHRTLSPETEKRIARILNSI